MISGHNTAVVYAGRIHQVQTELRGPDIESVVFCEGEVVWRATKRAPEGVALPDAMKRQHDLSCRAVATGRAGAPPGLARGGGDD